MFNAEHFRIDRNNALSSLNKEIIKELNEKVTLENLSDAEIVRLSEEINKRMIDLYKKTA